MLCNGGWASHATLQAIEVVTPRGRIIRAKRPALCDQGKHGRRTRATRRNSLRYNSSHLEADPRPDPIRVRLRLRHG